MAIYIVDFPVKNCDLWQFILDIPMKNCDLWPFIVAIKNGDFPQVCKRLPEGNRAMERGHLW